MDGEDGNQSKLHNFKMVSSSPLRGDRCISPFQFFLGLAVLLAAQGIWQSQRTARDALPTDRSISVKRAPDAPTITTTSSMKDSSVEKGALDAVQTAYSNISVWGLITSSIKSKYHRGYLVEQPLCPGSWLSVGEASNPSRISEDHVLVGVTCIFPKEKNTWECRDCGLDCQFTAWSDCPVVKQKGSCKPIARQNWDEPGPRSASREPPEPRVTHSHVHILTHKGMDSTYEQIPCERLEDCWDLSKCLPGKKLAVYAHGSVRTEAARYLVAAVDRYPEYLEQVADPEAACLLLVTCDSFQKKENMTGHASWKGGQNHLIWDASQCFGEHTDRPYSLRVHYQKAALATVGLTDANIRIGYDVSIPYIKKNLQWPMPKVFPVHPDFPWGKEGNDAARWWNEERPTLLSFKGNMNRGLMVDWQHRYLAAQYWERADDIIIDTTCFGKKTYDLPRDKHQEILMNSTFAFSPGGGSVGSFRFNEVMGMGCIPIVMSHFVPPFSPELDWSGCLLTISEGRIADLPRLVRSISKEDIAARRERCAHLFRKAMGWEKVEKGNEILYQFDKGKKGVSTSLLIWQKRIQQAHEMKAFMDDM